MIEIERENSTTNIMLVILLILVVGFVVWYVTGRDSIGGAVDNDDDASLEINLGDNNNTSGGSDDTSGTGGTGTQTE